MKYATGAAFRAALEARIRQESNTTGIGIARLRKLVAFDRLLARLLIAAPDRWIAKGGLALNLRFADRARTTMDLDLARQDDRAQSLNDLLDAVARDIGDFFTFELRVADPSTDLEDASAERYQVVSVLGGRVFEELRVDVGFEAVLPTPPDFVSGIRFLEFAGLDSIQVPVLPLPHQVAEKLHAYTLVYPGNRQSTRVKDLIDLVMISAECPFESCDLYDALDATFRSRATHDLPTSLPPPPNTWAPAYRTLAIEVGVDEDLSRGHAAAASFLEPVLSGAVNREFTWHHETRKWLSSSPD